MSHHQLRLDLLRRRPVSCLIRPALPRCVYGYLNVSIQYPSSLRASESGAEGQRKKERKKERKKKEFGVTKSEAIDQRPKPFNDLIDDFTKSDFKSFWDDFEIFKIPLKYGDLI
jgi:hypothetical protein